MFNLGIIIFLIIVLTYISYLLKSTSVMVLVFVLAVFGVISAVSVVLRCRNVRGHMHLPIEISESGRENLVQITIQNNGSRDLLRVKVLIVIKDMVYGGKKKYWLKLPVIQTGENEFVESIVFPEMGKFEMKLKKIRVYDISGLVYGDVWTKDKGLLQVMPGMYEVPVFRTEVTKNFYGEADSYDEHISGYDNSEIFQIREYQQGDRLQNVHWKLTAKHEELVVKEHSLPKACPVILLLDYHPKGFWENDSRMVAFMEAAAALSFSIMSVGCPHYVVWYDKKEKDVVRVRVDDEESMYYFIGVLMEVQFGKHEGALLEYYKDKYRSESYVFDFMLDEELVFKKGQNVVAKLSANNLKQTLSEVELVL